MPPASRVLNTAVPSLIELDRFSSASLELWSRVSADLDQLSDTLHFGTEPERLKYRDDLLGALQCCAAPPLSFERWTRMVTYSYSLSPLSAAGSLTGYGGRFNVGRDVEKTRQFWPALYIAATHEAAYREYYQLSKGSTTTSGLTPEEMNLETRRSTSTVLLNGHIEKVFNVGDIGALEPVCAILKKIKLPRDVGPLIRRLKMKRNAIAMITSPALMQKAILENNWRIGPVQFGLPSPSQILAELIRSAGYEAIQYPSTKNGDTCVAVFPSNIASDRTFVALSDSGPEEISHLRLDMDTADQLCGWEMLRTEDRPSVRG